MRKIPTLFLALIAGTAAHGQCADVAIQISSSDTGLVQLYHAGIFLLDSGYANVCTWQVTTLNGTIVHQDTTSGGFADQSFSLFTHNVPLGDSMAVSLVITNPVTGAICTITDTLLWQETEVLPGSFIGNWVVLNSTGGISTGAFDRGSIGMNMTVYPSPADDQVRIHGAGDIHVLEVVALNGDVIATWTNVRAGDRVDVSRLSSGMYLVRTRDLSGAPLGTGRFVKR